MSSATPKRPGPPRGRPSRAVYRRRRAVALLLVLLLVAAVAWGVTALLRGGEDAGAAPRPSQSAAGEPTAADPTDDGDDAPEETSGEVVACTPASVTASLTVDTADTGARFEVTVRNTGDSPCLVDAGPANLVAAVGSGSDDVWSSAHCADDTANELLLDIGSEAAVPVSWNGHRSAEGCPGDQPKAGDGTYRVSLELAGEPLEVPERQVFTLG